MSIQFTCGFCRTQLEADEELAGRAISCPNCSKVCLVAQPDKSAEREEKPHLSVSHQKQAVEELSESRKHCPHCRAEAEHGAVLCVRCGYNFITGTSLASGKRRKRERLERGFVGRLVYIAVWVTPFLVLGVAICAALVWREDSRGSRRIGGALEIGDADRALQEIVKLDSWHRWTAFVGWPNPYAFLSAQLQTRRGKTYLEAKESQLPLVVDAVAWDGRAVATGKAWVHFRFINYSADAVLAQPRHFLLVGTSDTIALAEVMPGVESGVSLQKGEGMRGALCFGGIIKRPAFLEYNDGSMLSRTPIYTNESLESFEHDAQGHPAPGKSADQFPIRKPWTHLKLTSDEVKKAWEDYVNLREPPVQPASDNNARQR